jgi:hypothetical protein
MTVPEGIFEREPLKDVPKRFLVGVGQVIVAHSRLEHYLIELIADLQRTDYPIIRQLLDSGNARDYFSKVERLIGLWNIVPSEDLETLREYIDEAGRRRNEVAHGIWLNRPDHKVALRRIRGKRETKQGMVAERSIPSAPITKPEEFEANKKYIDGVTRRIRALQADVRKKLEPWPYTDLRAPPKPTSSLSQGRTGKIR